MYLKGKIPFVRFLIPMVCGILAGYLWLPRLALSGAPVLMFCFLAALAIFMHFYKRKSLYQKKWLAGFFVHCFLLLTGFLAMVIKSEKFSKTLFSNYQADALFVTVKNEPKTSGELTRLAGNVIGILNKGKSTNTTGKLLLTVKADPAHRLKLSYGQVILIPAKFSETSPPYNPGEFDYKSYLANQRIYFQAFVNQEHVIPLPQKETAGLMTFAINFRQRLVLKFKKFLHDGNAASLAATLILGYRSELSEDVVNAYSKTGTMHVLSVSGMHVGIVFYVLSLILKPIEKRKYLRFVNAGVIITLIWFYSLVTGFSPSVCRAAVMLSFIVLGKTINRNQNTYNLIAISALILLVYDPYYLFDVGFQLSYLAVVGLVFFHNKIYGLCFFRNWLADKAWSYCALSISAQLATFPLSLFYFHQFPAYFLISNLIIVVPVIVIMYGGLLFLFIPWPAILHPLGELLNITIQLTNNTLHYIEQMPFSTFNGIWLSSFEYLLIYAIIGGMTTAILLKKSRPVFFTAVCVLLFCSSLTFKRLTNGRRSQIVFYSLRQSSAIAYINGSKALILSDLERADKTMSFSVDPSLSKCGISEREYRNITSDVENISRRNFFKFGSYKILRWDKTLDRKILIYPIKVDALLLTGNPNLKLTKILSVITCSVLIIDGTNSNYRINTWKREAEKLKLKFHVLKKNPAYIVTL